jgi:ethanolamine ammonia-lyase large subunit
VLIGGIRPDEDVFSYLNRVGGCFDKSIYGQLLGAANEYKDGDATRGLAADNDTTRGCARELLSRTRIRDLYEHPVFVDELQQLIHSTTDSNCLGKIQEWTLAELKIFFLKRSEEAIQEILPGLDSDLIGLLVRLMSNEELCQVGAKVFNPLPASQLGAKGYLGARIQPNSPTDNPEDILWQVFDGWCYATGDLLLGTNPVSDSLENIAAVEEILKDVLQTFGLEEFLPWCVLAHIDKQAELEQRFPDSTAIWFQSLAGVDDCNRIFGISVDKMMDYAASRNCRYGLYLETGQGADATNGMAKGFDMVLHESRKYGFVRALAMKTATVSGGAPWIHVNDVGGFIGPEVFRTKEQLVRACLEDTVMGKLHGLTTGLDICATLHMDISLDDLNEAQDEIIKACPAYLMALPTKNDPMLSYLTTGFQDHVRLREKNNLRVNDVMWDFFKRIEIVDNDGNYTEHFGDPIWVYYKYLLLKGDSRSKEEVYREGQEAIKRIKSRGVPIAMGYGKNCWDLTLERERDIRSFYDNAKEALWAEIPTDFVLQFDFFSVFSKAIDRSDYIEHPLLGEKLRESSLALIQKIRESWGDVLPDVQIVISDGLNSMAITDENHLMPYLDTLEEELENGGYSVADDLIFLRYGRVRAGYEIGALLFAEAAPDAHKTILHVIGERPGSGHHNYSVYIAAPRAAHWAAKDVNHDIVRVVSGISDTAFLPAEAARETVAILNEMTV